MSNIKYNFYYDETEHSQKMSFSTFNADNYSDVFTTVFIGLPENLQTNYEEKYILFEQKYINRFSKGELKSNTLKNELFKFGFASLDNKNVEFINDLLDLFDDSVKVIITSISKIEYVLNQVLESNFKNNLFAYNKNSLLYIVSKAIDCYKPKEVFKTLFDDSINNDLQIYNLIEFFHQRIKYNYTIKDLKYSEIEAFKSAILLLQKTETIKVKAWNYQKAFEILNNYLQREKVIILNLYLDKEGTGNTENAAKLENFRNIIQIDSKNCFGIRMADMLAGLINKLLRAINKELAYDKEKKHIEKKSLTEKWFKINESQLNLYKKLSKVINNPFFAYSIYGDKAIYLINLIEFMSSLTLIDYSKTYDNSSIINKELFDIIVYSKLKIYFEQFKDKQFW